MDKDCRSCTHMHMVETNRREGDNIPWPPSISIVQRCFSIDNATFVHDIDVQIYTEKHRLYCDNFKPANLSAQEDE
jgi:hypothetical protein